MNSQYLKRLSSNKYSPSEESFTSGVTPEAQNKSWESSLSEFSPVFENMEGYD